MLTIMALGFSGTFLMLGFLIAKLCKLIEIQKPAEGYKGGGYVLMAIILAVFMTIVWLGEGGALR